MIRLNKTREDGLLYVLCSPYSVASYYTARHQARYHRYCAANSNNGAGTKKVAKLGNTPCGAGTTSAQPRVVTSAPTKSDPWTLACPCTCTGLVHT